MDDKLKNHASSSEQKYQQLVEKSLQGIVILQNFQIIYTNPAFARMTGYSVAELLALKPDELMILVHPDDREKVWGNFRKRMAGADIPPHYKFKGLTKDGKEKILDLYASVIDYEGKPALQGLILDITEQVETEKKLKQRNELIETIVNNLSLGIAVIEEKEKKYSFINKEINRIFGLDENEVPDIDNLLRRSNGSTNFRGIKRLKNNDENKDLNWDNIEITTRNGQKKFVSAKKIPLKEQNLTIFTIQDTTERLKAETFLKNSITEKEILLREIHHRVKNNLQTISSLLDLQAETINEPRSIEAFRSSQSRIRSMALIHERLYKSENLSRIKAKEYIENLIEYLEGTYHTPSWNIEILTEIENLFLNLDVAIPCGLIVNELVSNSIKYAFPGDEKGKIIVSLKPDDADNLILIIKDDGIGIPLSLSTLNSQSLGLELVQLLVKQLKGKLEIDGTSGTKVKIVFPKPPIIE